MQTTLPVQTHTCDECGSDMPPHKKRQRFCGRTCSVKHRHSSGMLDAVRALRAAGKDPQEKVCARCQVMKAPSDYRVNAYTIDGLDSICRECSSSALRERRTDARDAVQAVIAQTNKVSCARCKQAQPLDHFPRLRRPKLSITGRARSCFACCSDAARREHTLVLEGERLDRLGHGGTVGRGCWTCGTWYPHSCYSNWKNPAGSRTRKARCWACIISDSGANNTKKAWLSVAMRSREILAPHGLTFCSGCLHSYPASAAGPAKKQHMCPFCHRVRRFRDCVMRDGSPVTGLALRRLWEACNGACAACNALLPHPYERTRDTALHHDHETGVILDWLCSTCNVIEGFVKKDVERVLAVAAYLQRQASGGTPKDAPAAA